MSKVHKGAVEITGQEYPEILSAGAVAFLVDLHQHFNHKREWLLHQRGEKQTLLNRSTKHFTFAPETVDIRKGNWQVAPPPRDLRNRQVEITGPAEAKMIIGALNSGANVFMADFEDSLSPTWDNLLQGQTALKQAVRRTLTYVNAEGKKYKLKKRVATLVVRPRGWHLSEKHFLVNGQRMSASLFDFGLYFYHNAHALLQRGSGPYFYLPKMESAEEAALWNEVFNFSQTYMGIPHGTIRATVLIETITAAFQMHEILWELKDHVSGLNAGRWDYIFSFIKKLHKHRYCVLPDRSQVTMAVPFMSNYAQLLVQACHQHGAHAMGGMSAFIPSRKDAEVNRVALLKVTEDKEREAILGFDGTWVAHPDLVPVAAAVFKRHLGKRCHQKSFTTGEAEHINSQDLLTPHITGGAVTEEGVTININRALRYIEAWLGGKGAVPLNNLMEDAATAEISRAQLWQWIHHKVQLSDGRTMTATLYHEIRNREMNQLTKSDPGRFIQAGVILNQLVLSQDFKDFLTTDAYEHL